MTDRQPTFTFRIHSVALAALLAASASGALAQATFDTSPEIQAAMKRLASEDPQVQRARWGDLAAAAGKAWLHVAPGEVASVWRHPRWVVPGAVMRYHRGFCIALKCQGTDYLVQYNERSKQLDFLEDGSMAYTGRIQEDGSVRLVGAGIIGVLTAETLKYDAAAGMLLSDKHELKPATGAQLAAATGGLAGNPAATQMTATLAASLPPTATATAIATGTTTATALPVAPQPTSSDAQLRAELAAMKAQVEALSRQVEQQGGGTAKAAAEPGSAPRPAAAQGRNDEPSAQPQAKASAAQDGKAEAPRLVQEKPANRESQLPAAAATAQKDGCKAEPIPVASAQALQSGQTRLFGTRSLADVELTGSYNAPEPDGHPRTVLEPGGGGTFEVYGAPKPQHVYRIRSWHIQANCDGTPVVQNYPAASRYFLIYKVEPAYQGQEWHRMQYIVRKDRIFIDDRSKPR